MRNQSGRRKPNGWSPSKDQATANSGIVVELKLEDFRLQNTVLWLEWNSKSIEQSLAFGW
jgi:hypothetical protein